MKDAVLRAAELAGDDYKADRENGDGGLVGYLRVQAVENPGPFMTLLGKVLPTQLEGGGGDPIQIVIRRFDAEDDGITSADMPYTDEK